MRGVLFNMNKLLFAIATIIAIVPPVNAQLIYKYENIAAFDYCRYRKAGVNMDDAMKMMGKDNLYPGKSMKVTHNGREVDDDVLKLTLAIGRTCPEYVGK